MFLSSISFSQSLPSHLSPPFLSLSLCIYCSCVWKQHQIQTDITEDVAVGPGWWWFLRPVITSSSLSSLCWRTRQKQYYVLGSHKLNFVLRNVPSITHTASITSITTTNQHFRLPPSQRYRTLKWSFCHSSPEQTVGILEETWMCRIYTYLRHDALISEFLKFPRTTRVTYCPEIQNISYISNPCMVWIILKITRQAQTKVAPVNRVRCFGASF